MAARSEAGRFESAQIQYARRIRAFARRKFKALPGTDPVDLEQELLEVLWAVCNSYDPDHGATFNTYFWECAKRRFLDLHKAASRQKRVGDYERVFLDDTRFRYEASEASEDSELLMGLAGVRLIHESAEEEAMARFEVAHQLRAGRKIS